MLEPASELYSQRPQLGVGPRCEALVAFGKAIAEMAFVITEDPEYYYTKHHSIVHGYRRNEIRPVGDQPFTPSLRTCNSRRSMPASVRSALRAR
jgi:hypothetical protein